MDNAPQCSAHIPVPNQWYFNENNMDLGNRPRVTELLAMAYIGQDPASYSKVMRSPSADEWMEACQYEIDMLTKNETWELVDLPVGCKAVKSIWVFKLKPDCHHQAHLVTKNHR